MSSGNRRTTTADEEPAFRIAGGENGTPPPVVLASPHSGQTLPSHFMRQTRLAPAELRRAEDCFVDELLEGAAALGPPLISARYGRTYIDLNRDPDELDARLLDSAGRRLSPPSDRVNAGMGVLPRLVSHGVEIYARKVRLADAEDRIARIHRPYHEALAGLLAKARATHGYALLLDCHSMPTPNAPVPPPNIVLGDLHGTSAAPEVAALVESKLVRLGFRVARNNPYAGGYTTWRHSRPDDGVHVLQLEIDRALYMDQLQLTPTAGFRSMRQAMTDLVAELLLQLPKLHPGPPERLAAE